GTLLGRDGAGNDQAETDEHEYAQKSTVNCCQSPWAGDAELREEAGHDIAAAEHDGPDGDAGDDGGDEGVASAAESAVVDDEHGIEKLIDGGEDEHGHADAQDVGIVREEAHERSAGEEINQ